MRRMRLGVIALLACAVLVGATFVQLVGFPRGAALVAETFPKLKLLVVPSITWGALAALCWQVAAASVLGVIVRVWNRRLSPTDRGWIQVVLGCVAVFFALALSAFIALIVMGLTTPGVIYGLIAGMLLAAIAAIAVLLILASVPRPATPAVSVTA